MHPHLLQFHVGSQLLIPQEYQEFLSLRPLCCCFSLIQFLTCGVFMEVTSKIADGWVWGQEEIFPWDCILFMLLLHQQKVTEL